FIPESLSGLIEATGALPAERAVALAIGISEGIGQAHAQGIIHRDIKPQNVLLTPQGIPKVTDFGIARDESLDTMTMTGVMMGTPYYMSPEQADGKRADTRSDVYSLGCLLYRLLAGEVPFSGETPLAILRSHVESTPQPLRKISGSVPRSVVKCVDKAMEKNPSKRYLDANAFAQDLRRAMPDLIVQTPPPAYVTPPSDTPIPVDPTPRTPEPVAPKPVTPISVPPERTPTPAPAPVPAGPSLLSRVGSGVGALVSGAFRSVRATLAIVGVVAVVAGIAYVILQPGDPPNPDPAADGAKISAEVSGGFAPSIGAANIVSEGDEFGLDRSVPGDLVATAIAKALEGGGSVPASAVEPTATATSTPFTSSITAGRIGYWSGDGSAQDGDGHNDGIAFGGVTYIDGVFGQAFSFDGSGYIEVGDLAEFEITENSSMSVSGWFKTSRRLPSVVVGKGDVTGPDVGWKIYIAQGRLQLQIADNVNIVAAVGGEVTDNLWHYFVSTHDSASGKMELYVDGALLGTNNENYGAIDDRGMSLRIGISAETADPFLGQIDEISIYNRVLDADEIRADYTQGLASLGGERISAISAPDGLVGWWPGDGNAEDVIGGNDGTAQGGVAYADGVVGQAFSFNGFSSFVEVPSTSELQMENTATLTVEAWIKIEEPCNGIINGRPFWFMHWGSCDRSTPERMAFFIGENANGTSRSLSSSSTVDGNWHHWAATYDGAQMRMYLDGDLDSSVAYSVPITNSTDGDPNWLTFGKDYHPDYGYSEPRFNRGLIDEIKIYSTALTAEQIRDNFEV
ncbi:MAG: LamG-like jellyroll fold domain-containing protein, partial [Dehalococcoidia bacterium]